MRRLLGFIIWLVYRSLAFTWRLQIIESDELARQRKNREPFVFAHWHGDELPLLMTVRKYRLATMISTSKDGQMVDTVFRLQGGKTSRGSSTRGAISALKGLLVLAKKKGRACSIAVDGPKGPLHEIKPGVFELSKILNAPIYHAGVACDKVWRAEKAWNKGFLPKPFAKVVIVWDGPVLTVGRDEDPRDPALADKLKAALHNSAAIAQKNCSL